MNPLASRFHSRLRATATASVVVAAVLVTGGCLTDRPTEPPASSDTPLDYHAHTGSAPLTPAADGVSSPVAVPAGSLAAYPGADSVSYTGTSRGYHADVLPGDTGVAYRGGKVVALPVALRSLRPSADGPPIPTVAGSPDSGHAQASEPSPGSRTESACDGIAVRDGDVMVIDGVGFFFFGINVQYLLEPEFPRDRYEPIVRGLSQRGVNTIRVWALPQYDMARLEQLLELGEAHGVRFVVVLGDNVFKGEDWFFGDDDEDNYRPHLQRTVSRFKDRPEILFWEVMNEPSCGEGRHDDDCLKTIRDWLTMASRKVKEIDHCHAVSTGMIGAGNYANELANYRLVHKKDSVDMLSVHKRSTDLITDELELAVDASRPIYYGEIFDRAYDEGCSPLGEDSLEARAERIKEDLRLAIEDGVDGYLLWNFSAGSIEGTDGSLRHYCSDLGYELTDPLWDKLQRSEGLPPEVPWRG